MKLHSDSDRINTAEGEIMKKKPVVLVVMDGVGLTEKDNGNAVKNAYLPYLRDLKATQPFTTLKAHGEAVGLPTDDDMGNSEVGHNALGSGQIYAQGAKLVNRSIQDKSMYKTDTWKALVERTKGTNTFHLIGLLSDGNVHSHINHVTAMLSQLKAEGVNRVALHALSDGRDVGATSALEYIDAIENHMAILNDETFDAFIASGGGRMLITMDRYDADWPMVERGWQTHVLGVARQFASATQAITTYRQEIEDLSDQYIPAWVVEKDGHAIAPIKDGDSVVFFNFRGDRALEISKAFEGDDSFDKFDRIRVPEVLYAGMLQYDGDLLLPKNFLVNPPHITNTLTDLLVKNNMSILAVSETQKYGHVTYFWNGNRTERVDENLETWIKVEGDNIPFEQRPWMKSAEITDIVMDGMRSGKYDFIRLNYPNGDMVGHTGDYQAAIISVEAVDLAIGRLKKVADETGSTLIILADHGNADEMYQKKKNPEEPTQPKTSHTLNPVPFIIYNRDVKLKEGKFGLANVAATVTDLLGIEKDPIWEESIIDLQD
jgi:2,3-bisphosphoglycerate-independent phosphoglycerate mutase